MGLNADLNSAVVGFFCDDWEIIDGRVVPDPDKVAFANEGVRLDATILYADISSSTQLVDTASQEFAARIYKAYLHCAGKVIESEDGVIAAYDGDRIMAVYLGDYKNTTAVRSALKINYIVTQVINPLARAILESDYQLEHVIGIDTSSVLVAQTGVRGAKDLVWVGRAANHAAKLCALPPTHSTRITHEVHRKLHDSAKTSNGKSMWEQVTWNATRRQIFRSNYFWKITE